MNIIDTISTRRSVRQFTSQPISDDNLHTILAAGMSGPSAVNARPWSFLVVRDRETLCKMADGNGNAAQPLKGAALGILVLGDMTRTFERAPEYWVIDCSIAAQNMILIHIPSHQRVPIRTLTGLYIDIRLTLSSGLARNVHGRSSIEADTFHIQTIRITPLAFSTLFLTILICAANEAHIALHPLLADLFRFREMLHVPLGLIVRQ